MALFIYGSNLRKIRLKFQNFEPNCDFTYTLFQGSFSGSSLRAARLLYKYLPRQPVYLIGKMRAVDKDWEESY